MTLMREVAWMCCFGRPKSEIPFLCLFQNKVRCPPCPYKKFKQKTSTQFWDIRQNIFWPFCPMVKQKSNTRCGRSRGGFLSPTPQKWVTSRGQKCQISSKTPFLFLSEQSRMSTLSVQKVWAKTCSHYFEISGKTFFGHSAICETEN